MAVNLNESRLRFLEQAALALAIPSPTVSASLGSARDKLLIAHDGDVESQRKEWDAHRREVCSACGNIMVPGWSCSVSLRVQSKKKVQRRSKSTAREKDIVYSCLRCDRKTVQSLHPRPPKHTRLNRAKSAEVSQASAKKEARSEDSSAVKSANATSKQRKKARKGGLQAMLERNKTNASASDGLGLDLMDFMR